MKRKLFRVANPARRRIPTREEILQKTLARLFKKAYGDPMNTMAAAAVVAVLKTKKHGKTRNELSALAIAYLDWWDELRGGLGR